MKPQHHAERIIDILTRNIRAHERQCGKLAKSKTHNIGDGIVMSRGDAEFIIKLIKEKEDEWE